MIKHLAGKTIFISGASRGIGKAIALRCAKDGANVIVAAKTADPHPKLPGTIYTTAKEIEDAGGAALPVMVDIRFEDQVVKAMEEGAKKFGGIDILINNASAIRTGTLDTPMKKYDLMNQINARGTYLCSRVAIPYLLKSKNPHILNLSPPLSLNPKWFKNNVAYTMAKYGMSFCVLGMSEEFKEDGIAVNALWPRTAISTDAIDLIAGTEMRKQSRTVEIMADAAYLILTKPSRSFTGNFVIDEDILRKEANVTNFDKYSVVPGNPLLMDFFIDEEEVNKSPSLQVSTKTSSTLEKTSTGTSGSSSSTALDVASSMNAIKMLISPDLVSKTNGVYAFTISDANPSEWFLDLKNGNGNLASGKFNGTANCNLTMNSDVFISMVSGKLKPTTAFMSGKLKIKGDVSLAMKLEKLMNSVKIEQPKPTSSVKSETSSASSSSGSTTDVAASMNQIKKLITPELVKSINGIYAFNISDANPSEWYLDLKNGNGDLAAGKFNGSANCTLTMKSDAFVSMVSGKIKPTTAFMSGKLKIKGDMALAMKLEKLMGTLKSKL